MIPLAGPAVTDPQFRGILLREPCEPAIFNPGDVPDDKADRIRVWLGTPAELVNRESAQGAVEASLAFFKVILDKRDDIHSVTLCPRYDDTHLVTWLIPAVR